MSGRHAAFHEIHSVQWMRDTIRDWRDDSVLREDERLEFWMSHAQVGEMFYHRLGVCVRLKDK
jgi:hypothetical protein